ncbi:hypothetical protein C8R44DRAFT_89200 [Mycena epipterygia]|nr:hypothetical protein C8R44DRAFT_89200 [Mycena epipterygia]
MPELDNVWKGFMKDAEGEDAHDFIIPPLRRGVSEDPSLVGTRRRVQAMLDPPTVRQPRPTMYRAGGSESTPYLACSADLSSESDSEYSNDETSQTNPGFPLSLFPAPPPLPMRRRTTPKPLVLLPTPTIAPLPPSPSISYSSRDSTPVATPTTPRSVEPSLYSARKSTSPVSILKKPGRSPASASPVTPTLPGGFPEQARSTFHILPPRLRSAQSVPHLQKPLLLATPTTHRNTSSDTTSMNNRRRTTSRPDASVKPQLYPKTRPPPSGNVEWGYAV